jgi:hypothetical protein
MRNYVKAGAPFGEAVFGGGLQAHLNLIKHQQLVLLMPCKVEYRKDPLTGHQTRINPARARRPKQGEGLDSQFEQVIASSQGGYVLLFLQLSFPTGGDDQLLLFGPNRCPFCPERILDKVPRFEPEVGKDDGRIFQGTAPPFHAL